MRLLRSHADGCCGDGCFPAGPRKNAKRAKLHEWHQLARETAESNASYGRPKKSREEGGRTWQGTRGRDRPKRPQRCEIRTLPCAGIIQIRFKGYFSPARHGQSGDRLRCAALDPRVSSRNNTSRRSVLATICNTPACVCMAYCIMATTVFSRMRSDIFHETVRQTRGGSCRLFEPLSSFGTLLPDPFSCFRHVVLPCPFCRDAQAACAPLFVSPGPG